ncbi:MAG: DUF4919 domain-containing protein [Candidatus Edwardsbacteria bacterium]|nr:DUF4919 domain-containing protein [Candidatus Edwardsbacteria bacterium]
MKKTALALIVLTAVAAPLRAQKISNVDFDAIRRAVSDTGSAYFYPRLWKRFLRFDTTLDRRAYAHLYYGHVYQGDYNPVNTELIEREREFLECDKAKKRAKAAAAARALVDTDPLNLKYNHYAGMSLLRKGDTVSARRYRGRWTSLINLILASGDGRSDSTAYVVIRVPDEYQVMGHLGLEPTAHFFRGGPAGKRLYRDVFELKPNKIGFDKIYFNTNWSYWYLNRAIEGETQGAK